MQVQAWIPGLPAVARDDLRFRNAANQSTMKSFAPVFVAERCGSALSAT